MKDLIYEIEYLCLEYEEDSKEGFWCEACCSVVDNVISVEFGWSGYEESSQTNIIIIVEENQFRINRHSEVYCVSSDEDPIDNVTFTINTQEELLNELKNDMLVES